MCALQPLAPNNYVYIIRMYVSNQCKTLIYKMLLRTNSHDVHELTPIHHNITSTAPVYNLANVFQSSVYFIEFRLIWSLCMPLHGLMLYYLPTFLLACLCKISMVWAGSTLALSRVRNDLVSDVRIHGSSCFWCSFPYVVSYSGAR